MTRAYSYLRFLAATPDGETEENFSNLDIEEAEEGRVITGLHRRYERNAAIVKTQQS